MMFKNLCPSALGISGHQSEVIELALTYGFSGIELNIVEFASSARLRGMPYARRLIDSSKLRIGYFPFPFDWDTDDAEFQQNINKLAEYAQVAAEIGCTRTVAVAPPSADSRPYHENFEFHRRRLSDIGAALAPSGVRLALGFKAAEYLRKDKAFQFIHDFDALTLLVNMVGSPSIGLLVDTWDIALAGGTADSLRKLPPAQLVAVQVAEVPVDVAPADLNETSRLLPGDEKGRSQVVGMLAALQELGYNGPVTAKPSRAVFTSRKRDLVVKQTAEALEKAWRAAGVPVEPRRITTTAREY
jgi:sugar phosphate isomerase/epimerase